MIKRMRYRLILSAMLSFFAVISLIAVLVNVIDYGIVTKRADETLDYIVGYEEHLMPAPAPGPVPEEPPKDRFMALPDKEANYMTRFFIVRYDSNGNIDLVSTDYVAAVDETEAVGYADKVLAGRTERGYMKEYRYVKKETKDTTVVIFLNVMRERQFMTTLTILTIIVSVVSLVLVFILVVLFSKRAIKPIADNIARQKQFITDASHELKTPLTSINTSIDVITMEHGDDEWTDNIKDQTGRMSKLVSELITLSRLDEEIPIPNKEQFSLSNAAWEIVEVYRPQAAGTSKKMDIDIAENINMTGDKQAIQQMLSVLLDNAIRYSDLEGEIRLSIARKKGKIRIEVFNTCDYAKAPDTEKLFDRFYRPDESRNKETGGNGVGLAIAKAVAETHGGSISAQCPSGKSMTIKVTL